MTAPTQNRDHTVAPPAADQHDIAAELLTYKDVARGYGFKMGTLYALVHQHRIPHVRIGRRFIRFRRTELETWLASKLVASDDQR